MDVQTYRGYLETPWAQLFYDLLFEQLKEVKGKKILDVGAGFCKTAAFLASDNDVTALEPNPAILALVDSSPAYQLLEGSLEVLNSLPAENFDLIVCHNVLEYIAPAERPAYVQEFRRLLRSSGQLSLVKHHEVGRILQTVVFENDCEKAQALLAGQTYQSATMGTCQVYPLSEVFGQDWQLEDYQGLRIFYGLQANDVKEDPSWRNKMKTMELTVCKQSPYRDIAAFQHLWLRKR